VDLLQNDHEYEFLHYLKLSSLLVGLLINFNFNVAVLKEVIPLVL